MIFVPQRDTEKSLSYTEALSFIIVTILRFREKLKNII